MAFDIFVSHSSKDKTVADATCAFLESRGIRCWIAPRDIRPGDSWGSSIVRAVRGARVMVLIFSSHANNSPQITREVELAVRAGLIVIPLRIEDVLPQDDLDYFLSTPHWLDAVTPPLEQHLQKLAEAIGQILKMPEPARNDLPEATLASMPELEEPALSPRSEPIPAPISAPPPVPQMRNIPGMPSSGTVPSSVSAGLAVPPLPRSEPAALPIPPLANGPPPIPAKRNANETPRSTAVPALAPGVAGSVSKAAARAQLYGLVGVFFFPVSFLAVISGHRALSEIKNNPALEGKGKAMTGLVLGYAMIGLLGLFFLLSMAGALVR